MSKWTSPPGFFPWLGSLRPNCRSKTAPRSLPDPPSRAAPSILEESLDFFRAFPMKFDDI